jgi:hypothetical protein
MHWAGVVRPIQSESLHFILEIVGSRVNEFSRFDDLANSHSIFPHGCTNKCFIFSTSRFIGLY